MKSALRSAIIILAMILLAGCTDVAPSDYQIQQEHEASIREENEEIAQKAYAKYKAGADYWDSVEPNIQRLDEDCVYWVPNGKSYHSTRSCVALLKSETICSGDLDEAFSEGKSDPCSKCVGD